jgi:hypothetical protein
MNGYLDEVRDKLGSMSLRFEYVRKYAWAIPSDEAVEAIVRYSPLVEGGAGTGYWASLINKAGGDIICYDHAPPGEVHNIYEHKKTYHPVGCGSSEKMVLHKDRTLLLCWPPYDTPMGYEHIKEHNGRTLILIGESRGGCTGDDDMFNIIHERYDLIETIHIPQWYGIHDCMEIFTHK